MKAPEQSFEYLAGRGLIRETGKIDREGIAGSIVTVLSASVVASDDPAEIQEKALTAAEIRAQVLGEPDDEDVRDDLDGLITNLTTIGTKGAVQKALENGQNGDGRPVLLSAKVVRQLVNGTSESTIKSTGRFLTTNPDVVQALWWDKQAARTEGDAHEFMRRQEIGARRVPQLGAKLRLSMQKLENNLALQLQMPTGS